MHSKIAAPDALIWTYACSASSLLYSRLVRWHWQIHSLNLREFLERRFYAATSARCCQLAFPRISGVPVLQDFTPTPPAGKAALRSVSGLVQRSVTETRLDSSSCRVRWTARPQAGSEGAVSVGLGDLAWKNLLNSSYYRLGRPPVALPHDPFARGSSSCGPSK